MYLPSPSLPSRSHRSNLELQHRPAGAISKAKWSWVGTLAIYGGEGRPVRADCQQGWRAAVVNVPKETNIHPIVLVFQAGRGFLRHSPVILKHPPRSGRI